MGRTIDISGKRFGRLIVVRLDHRCRKNNIPKSYWVCACDCGKKIVTERANLKSGDTKSCGCLAIEIRRSMHKTHGLSSSYLYRLWRDIKSRCYNKNNPAYCNYGGRGIRMQPTWENNFETFYRDISPIFIPGYSIERVDNDGHYELINIKFIPFQDQAKNRRSAVILTIGEVSKSVTEWCKELKINSKTVFNRKRSGWNDYDALFHEKKTNQHG